ncbi:MULTISPECIES: hypothetical protein [Methylomicrobium]|nr:MULTISPECIES: hypothetical protein [Methylomicrobium]
MSSDPAFQTSFDGTHSTEPGKAGSALRVCASKAWERENGELKMPTGRVPATGQIVNSPSPLGSHHIGNVIIKYTRRADSSGWLTVKLSKSDQRISLCEYTQVAVLRRDKDRTYFKIMDGYISLGEIASLTNANAGRYLDIAGPAGAASVTVEYQGKPVEEISKFKGKLKQQWATLTFNTQAALVTLNSVWNGSYSPIPPGSHIILAPDYSHQMISTAGYVAATPGMIGNDVWFPIGINGTMQNSSRYIHVGHLSEGCVTVHELGKWTAIYNYLISHRVPGSVGKKVGHLIVKQ